MSHIQSRDHGVLLETFATKRKLTERGGGFAEYGRTCKDIGCRRDEVCVMAEDPCSIYQRDNCGRYPTCAKAHPGGKNAVDLSINIIPLSSSRWGIPGAWKAEKRKQDSSFTRASRLNPGWWWLLFSLTLSKLNLSMILIRDWSLPNKFHLNEIFASATKYNIPYRYYISVSIDGTVQLHGIITRLHGI